jgi:hypothetical protein
MTHFNEKTRIDMNTIGAGQKILGFLPYLMKFSVHVKILPHLTTPQPSGEGPAVTHQYALA